VIVLEQLIIPLQSGEDSYCPPEGKGMPPQVAAYFN